MLHLVLRTPKVPSNSAVYTLGPQISTNLRSTYYIGTWTLWDLHVKLIARGHIYHVDTGIDGSGLRAYAWSDDRKDSEPTSKATNLSCRYDDDFNGGDGSCLLFMIF